MARHGEWIGKHINMIPEYIPVKSDRLLKLRDVKARTSLGHSTIYRKMAAGTFPKPRQLGPGCVRWMESEIDYWIENLPVSGGERVQPDEGSNLGTALEARRP